MTHEDYFWAGVVAASFLWFCWWTFLEFVFWAVREVRTRRAGR